MCDGIIAIIELSCHHVGRYLRSDLAINKYYTTKYIIIISDDVSIRSYIN